MKSFDEIHRENLRLILAQRFGDRRGAKKAFADKMGWAQAGLVSRYLKDKRIDKDLARRIEELNGYPPHWMDKDHSESREPEQLNLLHQVNESENFYHLPLNRRFLQGGLGVDTVGDTKRGSIAFRKDYMDEEGLDVNKLETWFVQGDSMSEILRPDDLVIVNTAIKNIIDGEIYAFYDSKGGGRIKYVYEQRDGALTLVSENSKKHPNENIPAAHRSDIEIVGIVELRSGRLRKAR